MSFLPTDVILREQFCICICSQFSCIQIVSHCTWLQTSAWRSGIKKRKACQFMYSHLTPVNSPSPVLWCGIVVTALTVWTTLKVWRQVVMETALRYRVWGRKQSFVSEPRTAWTATAQRTQLLCDSRAKEPWQKDPLTQNLNGYNVLDTECNYVSLSANTLLVSIGISVLVIIGILLREFFKCSFEIVNWSDLGNE